jgi:hypothetical protein
MGADIRLESLDRELNRYLLPIQAATWATLYNGEYTDEERIQARESAGPIDALLYELWDHTAQFRDPYNETSLSAYLGYDYHNYTAGALAIAEGQEREDGSDSYIPPQGAAMLLRHLETMEGHIIGPEALGKAEDYWRLFYWGGQEGNPSMAMMFTKLLPQMLPDIEVKPGFSPEGAEESLSNWRDRYEKLTHLLKQAILRGEALECSL